MKKNQFILSLLILTLIISSANIYSQEGTKKKLSPAKTQPATEKQAEAAPATKSDSKKTDAKTNKKAAKPMVGQVCNFNKMVRGGSCEVTKAEAVKLASDGQPIVFCITKGKSCKIYFVYNADGTFASKKLANFAANKKVAIYGTSKTVNGINVIWADNIESAD